MKSYFSILYILLITLSNASSAETLMLLNDSLLQSAVFANKSPGADFLWGTADDVTFMPGTGTNTIGGAGRNVIIADPNLTGVGGTSLVGFQTWYGSGTVDFTPPSTQFGTSTVNSVNFQGELSIVGGSFGLTQTAGQASSSTTFSNNTWTVSGERTFTDGTGRTLTFVQSTSDDSTYLVNGQDPSVIFSGNADLIAHYNFLISALSGSTWDAIYFERNTSTSSEDVVSETSLVWLGPAPTASTATTVNVPLPLWSLFFTAGLLVFFGLRR